MKPVQKHSYRIASPFWDELSLKTSLLVKSEFLGLLANTLTADGNCSRYNRESFQQPIQKQLSKKRKTFF